MYACCVKRVIYNREMIYRISTSTTCFLPSPASFSCSTFPTPLTRPGSTSVISPISHFCKRAAIQSIKRPHGDQERGVRTSTSMTSPDES